MKTIALVLQAASPLQAGFHFRIENPPWQPLVVEDIQQTGPNGLPVISVAHYGEQNGDPMRDPEMLFELGRRGDEIELTPYYWRNDYVGIEEYSAIEQDDHWLVFTDLRRRHSDFAKTWDANLRAQGYVEAFLRGRKS